MFKGFINIVLLGSLSLSINAYASKIVTSIRPIQSIVANLTKNVDNNIGLVIDKNVSIHNYSLTPLKARKITKAKTIIIIDRDFEVFLNKIYKKLSNKNIRLIEIAKLPGVRLLPAEHTHDHHGDEHDHHHHSNLYDYHLWLDINLVKQIAKELTKIFIAHDQRHEDTYENNLKEFIAKLDNLDLYIKSKLQNAHNKNYIVTHNAYQYFINKYHLSEPRSITIDHDHNIGAGNFIKTQNLLKEKKIECIFEEPQFQSQVIENLKKQHNVKVYTIDAEWGDDQSSLEDVYFVLMQNLANSFAQCLN